MDARRVVVGADADDVTSVWSDGPSPQVHTLPCNQPAGGDVTLAPVAAAQAQ